MTTHFDAPPVPKTSVAHHFLHALQVFSHFGVQPVSHQLRVCAVHYIPSPIEEPVRDVVVLGVGKDSDYLLNLFLAEFASTFVEIYSCALADDVGKAASNSFDFCDSKGYLLFSVEVCIEDTEDVIKFAWACYYD